MDRRTLAVLVAAVSIVLVWYVLARTGTDRMAFDDSVVVHTEGVVAATPPQSILQVTSNAATEDVSGVERQAILRALRLTPNADLHDAVVHDAAQGVVCGMVSTSPPATARRFVYIGAASLGAIDDGGGEFDRLASRVCLGSADRNRASVQNGVPSRSTPSFNTAGSARR